MPRHSHLRYVPPAVILRRYRAERRHMEDMRPPFPRWAAWVEMVVRRRTLGTVKAAASAAGPDPPAPTSSAVGTCRATRRGRQPSGALDRGGGDHLPDHAHCRRPSAESNRWCSTGPTVARIALPDGPVELHRWRPACTSFDARSASTTTEGEPSARSSPVHGSARRSRCRYNRCRNCTSGWATPAIWTTAPDEEPSEPDVVCEETPRTRQQRRTRLHPIVFPA